MTKKELLEMLKRNQNILLKDSYDPCEDYYKKLSDLLRFIQDDKTEIEGLSSLEEFEKSKNAFDDFVRKHNNDTRYEVKEKLNTIYTEIKTWVTNNDPIYITKAENNAIGVINSAKRTVLISFITIIILLAVAAIVCTILHIFFEFKYGEQMAEAIGTLDFALGVIAFVIERFSDIKKDKIRAISQEGRESGDVGATINKIDNSINQRGLFNIGIITKTKIINKNQK